MTSVLSARCNLLPRNKRVPGTGVSVTSVLSARCNKISKKQKPWKLCFSDLSPKRALQPTYLIWLFKKALGFSDLSPKRALQPKHAILHSQIEGFSDLSPKRALQPSGKYESFRKRVSVTSVLSARCNLLNASRPNKRHGFQ